MPPPIRARSNLTLQQAAAALAQHRPYRLLRQYRDRADTVHTRELHHAGGGVLYVTMDLHGEPRHLTVEDIESTTWKEVIG